MNQRSNKKSFTLIETIAAVLLLGLSVVVLSGIGVHALRTACSLMIDEQARDLADRQLTMVDSIGVQKYHLNGPTKGTFEGDGVVFDWTLEIPDTTQDFLYEVTVTVGWLEQHHYKKIQAQTRLYGA